MKAVVRRVSGRVPNGAIICLRDGCELRCKPDVRTTIAAVERLIPDVARFKQLNIDSMDAVEILLALENEFDTSIPDEEVRGVRTVCQMCEGVERLGAAKAAREPKP